MCWWWNIRWRGCLGRFCHPRQRLPGCRLGGRHDGVEKGARGGTKGNKRKRRYVAVGWIVRFRIIRRPACQRWARPKFILFEAEGKFMNFSVRRASMSGWRRIQRRHSFLPFFCCRKKGSTSVARKPFVCIARKKRTCGEKGAGRCSLVVRCRILENDYLCSRKKQWDEIRFR